MSPIGPFVIQVFDPFIKNFPFLNTARVSKFAGFEPRLGSVKQKHPTFSPFIKLGIYLSFYS